jgi:hypothetical protein
VIRVDDPNLRAVVSVAAFKKAVQANAFGVGQKRFVTFTVDPTGTITFKRAKGGALPFIGHAPRTFTLKVSAHYLLAALSALGNAKEVTLDAKVDAKHPYLTMLRYSAASCAGPMGRVVVIMPQRAGDDEHEKRLEEEAEAVEKLRHEKSEQARTSKALREKHEPVAVKVGGTHVNVAPVVVRGEWAVFPGGPRGPGLGKGHFWLRPLLSNARGIDHDSLTSAVRAADRLLRYAPLIVSGGGKLIVRDDLAQAALHAMAQGHEVDPEGEKALENALRAQG